MNVRPIGTTWTETTADGKYVATYEIIAHIDRGNGVLREEVKRVRFRKVQSTEPADRPGS